METPRRPDEPLDTLMPGKLATAAAVPNKTETQTEGMVPFSPSGYVLSAATHTRFDVQAGLVDPQQHLGLQRPHLHRIKVGAFII